MHQLFRTVVFIDSVDVNRTNDIIIFNVLIHLLKGNLISTLGDSVVVYKTLSVTHITIIGIPIMLRDFLVVHGTITITLITYF